MKDERNIDNVIRSMLKTKYNSLVPHDDMNRGERRKETYETSFPTF